MIEAMEDIKSTHMLRYVYVSTARRGYRNLLRGMRDFEKGKLYKKGEKEILSIKTIL